MSDIISRDRPATISLKEASPELGALADVVKLDQYNKYVQAAAGYSFKGPLIGAVTGNVTGSASLNAPMPQAGAGAGQIWAFGGGLNVACTLPSGGSWWWWMFGTNSTGGVSVAMTKGISAGGTIIGASNGSNGWEAAGLEIQDAKGFDSTQPVLTLPDGSFIVTTDNGYPYNVLASDPVYAMVQAWIASGGQTQPYVPPVAVPPTARQAAQQAIQTLLPQVIAALVPPNAVGPNAALFTQYLAAIKAANS